MIRCSLSAGSHSEILQNHISERSKYLVEGLRVKFLEKGNNSVVFYKQNNNLSNVLEELI